MATTIPIFIRSAIGGISSVECKKTDLIEDVKQRLYQKEGIDSMSQSLVYQGKPLVNGRTVGQYNIEKGSTINMVLRLHGGDGRNN
ncbi:hypothetical protein SNEBB_005137 [Seison nebaliae]|nr:hypothetical protein SNEBB_005137 [Seison nebaliae]